MDSVFTQLRKHGVHVLYSMLIEPRRTDEDGRRRERILNILLIASIALSGMAALAASVEAYQQHEVRGVPLWILWGITLFFIALFQTARHGHVRLASYTLLVTYIIPTGYTAYAWGSDVPVVLLAYALIITMASVLISTRISLLVTALVSAYLLTLAHLQTVGVLIPKRYWRMEAFTMPDAAVGVALFVAVAVVAWLSNREIEQSLKRARTSEQALRRERDQLEETVEHRTTEIRKLQMEKISQQYRFIEFGRLASGFFHDLATPLNVVSLHLEKLQAAKPEGIGDVSSHVERALCMARRMETFLQSIRRQLIHQEVVEEFAPAQELHSVVEILNHKAQTVGVTIHIHAPEHIRLHGNPIKFHQLFANLVSNAIDAYEGHDPERLKPIQINMKVEGDILSIRVQDWGSGITAENRKRIFEPFFTTKSAEKGLGIGLAMSKKIAESDFGGILVLADTDIGTKMIVRIPMQGHPTSRH